MQKVVFVTGTIRSEASWPLIFAKGLSKSNLDVTVISGYANINVSDEYREHQLSNPLEILSPTLKIIRVGSRKKDPHSLAGRCIKYFQLTAAIAKELEKHKADCYIFYSTPPFLGLIGGKMSKKGEKTIYIAQDLFPDTLFALKPRIKNSAIGMALRKMERYIYDNNSTVVTISETMRKMIISNSSRNDINVIPNWASVDVLHNVRRENNSLFDEYGIDREKFIISYAGSLGLFQNVDILLDVAKELKNYSQIEFVIFGNGVCKEALESRINTECIHNVKILPFQPKSRVSEVYSFGDLEYVSVNKGVMEMACPHKICDIFSVGSPILAAIDSNCDIAYTIKEKQLGYVVELSIDSIKHAILEAFHSPNELRMMGESSRQFAMSINFESQIEKYVQLI